MKAPLARQGRLPRKRHGLCQMRRTLSPDQRRTIAAQRRAHTTYVNGEQPTIGFRHQKSDRHVRSRAALDFPRICRTALESLRHNGPPDVDPGHTWPATEMEQGQIEMRALGQWQRGQDEGQQGTVDRAQERGDRADAIGALPSTRCACLPGMHLPACRRRARRPGNLAGMLHYNNRPRYRAMVAVQALRQARHRPWTSSVCACGRKPSARACASINSATRSSQTSCALEQLSQIRNGT